MPRLSPGKLKREAIPLLLFGSMILIKLYYLTQVLVIGGGIDKLLYLIHSSDIPSDDARLFIMDMVSYIAYNVIAITFDALVFVTYLIRTEPKHRAHGFSERVFPLATVLLPVVGFTLLAVPQVRAMVPMFDSRQWVIDYHLPPLFPLVIDITALTIGLVGAALSIAALWSLRRSFSLMAEVRQLVSSGLYSRIRHPLYMAEIIHIFGVALLSGTPVGLWLYAIALVMQVIRAKIEERKFLREVPEYAHFMGNTGFLWPRLGPRQSEQATAEG